ncbi:hypothetical protein ACOSQ3_017458 [Xanthoceras sorbifolium]
MISFWIPSHTLRKQLFPEEISGHNLHDSGETKADVVHPIPPPLVLDMDNLKKAPVMDDGATSDSVDSLLVSLQGVENRSHATHATKEGMSHIDSTKHEQLNSLNSLCVEQLVGSLSLPLPQDTVSRIKSDKKKKWKRLARWSNFHGPPLVHQVVQQIDSVAQILIAWNNKNHQQLFANIKRLRSLLATVNNNPSSYWQSIRHVENQLDAALQVEETFWRQRSRTAWLSGGDQNTKYFHVRATRRKAKNHISGLHDDNNVWCSDKSQLFSIIQNYFASMFQSQLLR